MGALSKGCISCKRKKVKCDEIRPTCTRCRNASLECTASTPRIRFVDEKPRIRRAIEISHTQSHQFSTVTSSYVAFHSSRISQSPPTISPVLASTLPLNAFKDDIFISYLLSKCFKGAHLYSFDVEDTCVLPPEWIAELVTTPGQLYQPPYRKSWVALAAIVFGKAHMSRVVVNDAIEIYGQALSELRSELSSPSKWHIDSMLAAMTALYIFELLAWKAGKGWTMHANGLERLLEWLGPVQQKSCVGKNIFFEHRLMLIFKSIISCQSTFLRNPVWKTVPWEDDPALKLPIDYLIDIGADIAEYFAQIKKCHILEDTNESKYSQLKAQITSSLAELNTWWLQWEADNAQYAVEIPAPHLAIGKPLFPKLLSYNTLWTAFTLCIYDTMRILLLQLFYMLRLPPNSAQAADQEEIALDVPNSTVLLGITSDTKSLACEILRSLTYYYGQTQRFVSTFSFMFIQDVAYGCFDPTSKEAIWAARHGWASFSKIHDDFEDSNLLKRLVPLGQINAGNLLLGASVDAGARGCNGFHNTMDPVGLIDFNEE